MPVGSKREIIICRAKRTLFTRIRPGKGVTATAKQKYVKQLGLIPQKNGQRIKALSKSVFANLSLRKQERKGFEKGFLKFYVNEKNRKLHFKALYLMIYLNA